MYSNLYIAKRDITYSSDHKKVLVPKGTAMSAIGGGYMGDLNGKIKIGNINGMDDKYGKSYPDIKDDKQNFEEVENPIWPITVRLTDKIEDWARDTKDIDTASKSGDINAVKESIKKKLDILKQINTLLK